MKCLGMQKRFDPGHGIEVLGFLSFRFQDPISSIQDPGFSVRMKGLEPPRLTAPDPKSGAATNYATSAFQAILPGCKYTNFGRLKR